MSFSLSSNNQNEKNNSFHLCSQFLLGHQNIFENQENLSVSQLIFNQVLWNVRKIEYFI